MGMTQKHKPSHHNQRLWVSESKICTPSSEEGESDVDTFLWSQRRHSPWVRTRWSNCKQGVLCQNSLLAAWCGVAQATCIVEARWLAAASWQCPHALVPPCTELLTKHQIPQVPHPPYSLDMAPCDCFLFLEVKMLLKGNRFQDMDEIKGKVMTQLLAVPNTQCPKSFGQWKDSWNKCVVSEGD